MGKIANDDIFWTAKGRDDCVYRYLVYRWSNHGAFLDRNRETGSRILHPHSYPLCSQHCKIASIKGRIDSTAAEKIKEEEVDGEEEESDRRRERDSVAEKKVTSCSLLRMG